MYYTEKILYNYVYTDIKLTHGYKYTELILKIAVKFVESSSPPTEPHIYVLSCKGGPKALQVNIE